VHTIKIANGHGTGRGNAGVVKASENLHEFVIFLIAGYARWVSA
jgi:hypothetical protein